LQNRKDYQNQQLRRVKQAILEKDDELKQEALDVERMQAEAEKAWADESVARASAELASAKSREVADLKTIETLTAENANLDPEVCQAAREKAQVDIVLLKQENKQLSQQNRAKELDLDVEKERNAAAKVADDKAARLAAARSERASKLRQTAGADASVAEGGAQTGGAGNVAPGVAEVQALVAEMQAKAKAKQERARPKATAKAKQEKAKPRARQQRAKPGAATTSVMQMLTAAEEAAVAKPVDAVAAEEAAVADPIDAVAAEEAAVADPVGADAAEEVVPEAAEVVVPEAAEATKDEQIFFMTMTNRVFTEPRSSDLTIAMLQDIVGDKVGYPALLILDSKPLVALADLASTSIVHVHRRQ